MIRCNQCNNTKIFFEIHVGGYRQHEWTQEVNGRFVFEKSNYDKVDDTLFECGNCHADLSREYRKFLQALFEPYDEKVHGV